MKAVKRITASILAVCSIFALTIGTTVAVEIPKDASADAWFYNAVEYVLTSGIMINTDKGFEPDVYVERSVAFEALYILEGAQSPSQRAPYFTDTTGKWFADSAQWAYETGLTSGVGGGLFAGEKSLSRQELAKLLHSYAEYKLLSKPYIEQTLEDAPDYDSVANWAVAGITYCFYSGIRTGLPDGSLNPKGSVTRAELAQALLELSKVERIEVDSKEKLSPSTKSPVIEVKGDSLSFVSPKAQDISALDTAIAVSGKASGVMLDGSFSTDVTEYNLVACVAGTELTVTVKAAAGTSIKINGKDAKIGDRCG